MAAISFMVKKEFIMNLKTLGNGLFLKVKCKTNDQKYHDVASSYNINGYKRIYLVHIRKTGGTSVNNMFLGISGRAERLYNRLAKKSSHCIFSKGKIYVGWNNDLISRGNYFYAFSHAPWHKLDLPVGTFSFTCFRDPVNRVISHYNMLSNYLKKGIDHPCMKVEKEWLGESFEHFLNNIPKKHLCNQLYMFSEDFNIEEAVENVFSLSHYLFTERFAEGIDELNCKTGLNLMPIHIRKSTVKNNISTKNISLLKEMLEEEYIFLEYFKKQ